MSRAIPLTRGLFAIVDDEDFKYLNQFKWHAHNNHGYGFYACRRNGLRGAYIQMHNLLLVLPAGMHTDHKDGNGLNNQKYNLRIATNQQNQWNCKRQKNCKSKYKGVHRNAGRGKWQGRLWWQVLGAI